MPTKTFESVLPTTPEELYAWHARPGAFERLCPPWQAIRLEQPAPIAEGSRARLSLRKGPFRLSWTAEHRDVEAGKGFTDVQTSGPFARWVHRHEFPAVDGGTLLRDRIDYLLPGGALGQLLAGRLVDHDLETTFAYRHRTTSRDLMRHQTFADSPRLRIAISGATGLVGSSLAPFLTTGGHHVHPLVRRDSDSTNAVRWDPDSGLVDPETAPPLDAVVHLAGENLAAGRWSSERKQRIRSSRVEGTRNLIRSLGRLETPPKTLVCASAIGYYGSRGDEILDETSEPGHGFLAEVCREWEEATEEALELGMRVVQLRFGIILTPTGGALAKMLPPFRLGGGGRLGDGRQSMSWISIDDAIGAVHHALMDGTLSGPVNVVSPNPVTNAEFTGALGRTLRRPTLFPLPAFAARLIFGEMADEMLLSSTRVRPAKLEKAGFDFADPKLDLTFDRLLGRAESP